MTKKVTNEPAITVSKAYLTLSMHIMQGVWAWVAKFGLLRLNLVILTEN